MSAVTLWIFNKYYDVLKDYELSEKLDKEVLTELILQECGEEAPYHQQPEFLKRNIELWFKRRYNDFDQMALALLTEYNPIYNYDRTEEWTDETNGTDTANGTNESKVSAFNSSEYQPSNLDTTSGRSTTKADSKHSGHIYGNIGVTTTQQMIESELNLRRYDLYKNIVSLFENEFLMRVY